MTEEEKVDILKLVYTEEGNNLRFETTTAQNLIRYFITVELAFGAWITGFLNVPDLSHRWILFLLNILFGACVSILVFLNYRRRLEVVNPLRSAVEAMGLTKEGIYLPDTPIHSWKFNASWRNWYFFLIGLFCLAQALPIFYIK